MEALASRARTISLQGQLGRAVKILWEGINGVSKPMIEIVFTGLPKLSRKLFSPVHKLIFLYPRVKVPVLCPDNRLSGMGSKH